MASISFDKCCFPVPSLTILYQLSMFAVFKVKSPQQFRPVSDDRESTTASMTPMTAAWMPKEMMSEDSEVLVAVCRLAARVLFEPMPKTTEGVAAMMKVLKPKLCQLFGSQSSSGLFLLWDEQFSVSSDGRRCCGEVAGRGLGSGRGACYLVVDPALHGQGLGSMLVRHCEDWATARGHEAIRLFHYTHKERLHHWYSKMGCQTVAHFLQQWQM